MTVVLAAVIGVLFTVGTYLILQRTLTRIIIGVAVLGHGANVLLLLAGGRAGRPPLVEEGSPASIVGPTGAGAAFVDPLPQALALTAIVIAFGVTAFLLALAYRSWLLHGEDEVEDDLEDQRIARLSSEQRDRP